MSRPSLSSCLSTFFVFFLFALPAAADKPSKCIRLFNGKDFSGWVTKTGKPEDTLKIGTARLKKDNPREITIDRRGCEMINFKKTGHDFYTKAKFGDAHIEVEFMIPKGSNSGVYVMGEYEIQILDSFGKEEISTHDMGGIYQVATARVNAAKAPGEWQKVVIDFRAPKFDSTGKKISNARFVKVTLNGKFIHENVELLGPTLSSLTGEERAKGPLMFQGDHGVVAYRNIKITPCE